MQTGRSRVLRTLVFISLDTKDGNENFELGGDKYYIYVYMFIYKTREMLNLRFIKFDIEGFYNKLSSDFANSCKFV